MKYYSSFVFFQSFKNVKIILNSRVIQSLSVGRARPLGHNLPTPAFNNEHQRLPFIKFLLYTMSSTHISLITAPAFLDQ